MAGWSRTAAASCRRRAVFKTEDRAVRAAHTGVVCVKLACCCGFSSATTAFFPSVRAEIEHGSAAGVALPCRVPCGAEKLLAGWKQPRHVVVMCRKE